MRVTTSSFNMRQAPTPRGSSPVTTRAWTTSGPPSPRSSLSRMGPTPPAPSSAESDRTNCSRLGQATPNGRPSRPSDSRLFRPERARPGFSLNAARSDPRSGRMAGCAGGEQAANTLQPAGSNRHATTANAKVRGPLAASPLVTRWRCWRSHGRGHRSWDAPHVAMAASAGTDIGSALTGYHLQAYVQRCSSLLP